MNLDSHTESTHHFDIQKEVSPSNLGDLPWELLEDNAPQLIHEGMRVAHLFAGNGSEALASLQFLKNYKVSGQVMLVDKETPSRDLFVDADFKPEFITSDALEFLRSQPDASLEIVTLMGAEPYFMKGLVSAPEFDNELQRVVKPGGIVYALAIPNLLRDEKLWKRVLRNDAFQRLESPMVKSSS
jgi:ubiquinone/menaquinone biosynthesis C-methylase UbiE